jgi:transposase
MAQFHDVKFLKEVEGLSQRQISKRLGIARNTVNKYLKQDHAPTTILRQKTYGTKEYSNETKRVLPIIDEWLEDDQKRWGKQKHTAARIYERLVEEYQFKGSESNLRKIVAKRRKKLQEVFIPLDFNSATNSNLTGERRILFYRVEHIEFTFFVCSSLKVAYDLSEPIYTKNGMNNIFISPEIW